jgi:hypothetical protein
VSRRFVLISVYRVALLHVLTRYWRGTLGRRVLLSFPQLQDLICTSGPHPQRLRSVLRFGHAQTFVLGGDVRSKNAAGTSL